MWQKRTRGWAKRGERAVRVVQGRRGNNFTMTFAVCPTRGLVHHQLDEGGMNGDRFERFIENLCAQVQLNENEQCAIILDNASPHRRIRDMNLPDGFEFRFLPPYSPFLNIAENAFSMWKAAVKRHMGTNRQVLLNESLHERRMMHVANIAEVCVPEVTAEAMGNAYLHMQTYLPRCWAQEDVLY